MPEELLDSSGVQRAIDVEVGEYVKILNQATGEISVVPGPTQVFYGPHDKMLDGGKKRAVEVDGEHAVLVRDKTTGQQRLVTEKQLFIPAAHEEIEEVRELVKLADHEAMIIKDKDGLFHYFYGDAERISSKTKGPGEKGARRNDPEFSSQKVADFECRFPYDTYGKNRAPFWPFLGEGFWDNIRRPLLLPAALLYC